MEKEKTSKKKLMVFGILGLFSLVLVTAATISYFGIWTGSFTVTQAIEVEENPVSFTENFVGDHISVDCDTDDNGHWVKNNAGVPVAIQFGTTCRNVAGFDDGTIPDSEIDWVDYGNLNCNGIVTEIYGILELTKKTTGWQPTGDPTITITYTIVGDTFEYEVISGSIPSGYELVYAMDKDSRWVNHAAVIKVNDIAKDLPYNEDWNIDCMGGVDDGKHYCNNINGFDDYEHCVGAKLWVVKTSDLGTPDEGVYPLNWANMWDYYYETDLIVYSDDVNREITLPANGGGFNFCVENNFVNLVGDTYTIETKILPVTA